MYSLIICCSFCYLSVIYHICWSIFIVVFCTMAIYSEEEIQDLRMKHESDAEWRLREQFLLAHRDSFSKGRLLCLSQCFINIECYGTVYPDGVMQQIKELHVHIASPLAEHRQRMIRLKESIKFVQSSNDSESRNIRPRSHGHQQ